VSRNPVDKKLVLYAVVVELNEVDLFKLIAKLALLLVGCYSTWSLVLGLLGIFTILVCLFVSCAFVYEALLGG